MNVAAFFQVASRGLSRRYPVNAFFAVENLFDKAVGPVSHVQVF